ncbi:Ger(x)C family spore germination protein [Pontibacillus marinus]|uniref:Spore germination protein n=1 Tax=Pontibacillus marinus BH030004 = DSM 16465 TaxID=1385511 RepID=A0A0A5GF88_9BACI|nr:Ger(x)C family spore germination protein [Pontibacillus marinus]KGX91881.1 hypothetical protein N783_00525 [Pontibacillus marinus BH030004 = DSM 16465]
MKGKTFIIFIISISLSLIMSFTIPKKIIDQIQMVTVMGYDQVEDEMIRGTAIVPKYINKNKVSNIIYTNVSELIYENQTDLNRVASEELYNGKLEIVLYGKELAKKGMVPYIDFLTRDPSIGSRTYLAIVEESAYRLINQINTEQSAGLYFSDLIEHNIINGNLPETNLKIFQTGIKSQLQDPFLPILKVKGDKAIIEGLGFFDKDKFVFTLPYDNAFLFNILKEEVGNGKYALKRNHIKASIQSIESTRDFKVEGSKANPIINVTLTLRGVLREYTGPSLNKNKDEINKMWKEDVRQKGQELINKFQELEIDPISIGLQVKANTRGFDLSNWKDIYPNAEIKLKVKSKLIETGTMN